MEEDRSLMYRRTVPGVMGISTGPNFEPNAAYYNYEEVPYLEAKWFYDMLKSVVTPLYEGYTKYSLLFAIVRLLNIKSENNMLEKCFDQIAHFNKQSACAKLITEIMKEYFVDAHTSFWKIPNRIKNMWSTKFGKMYRWDPMHDRVIWDTWEKRASLRYTDLMYEVRVDKYQPNWMTTVQYTSLCDGRGGQGLASIPAGLGVENGRGIRKIRVVRPTALVKGTVGRHAIQRVLDQISGAKGNAECLHIETSSLILIDEQLIFEAAYGKTRVMYTVLAHNLWPSPTSDGEVVTTRHRYCRYLLQLPMSPTLIGRRGCEGTYSKHKTSSPAS
ncbi:hypothetical protein M9H77_16407 [Catharanthus roseus]|uniref:Uncharacterized protein n=1 Tax=Catharanthus roseus TaxID=4058 RepID=A0ACC0B1P6_CATRO|nr:hypothetical protein M9H77_16407 [Catharanthus roseus]